MVMVICRICIDEVKKPVSLPCGHVFCGDCIVKSVQAPTTYTHLRPCPICRSMYNVAPINVNVIPANLRPFVTPSIRRLYLNAQTAEEESAPAPTSTSTPQDKDAMSAGPSTSAAAGSTNNNNNMSAETMAELSRLREENSTLRTHCSTWRRRAEMHGSANLNLINFAKVLRDQAAAIARERDELSRQCDSLKRKIEDKEMSSYSQIAISDFFPKASEIEVGGSPEPDSLLFAPPFQLFSRLDSPPRRSSPSDGHDDDESRPRKRLRTGDDSSRIPPSSGPVASNSSVSEPVASGSGSH